jgi:D-alanyl-D-alanine carboxypeptidase
MHSSALSSNRRQAVLSLGSVFLLQACGGGKDPLPTDQVSGIKPEQIKAVLANARGTAPGLAGGVISDSAIVLAADGKRSSNAPALLSTDNWLHLGSNSKSLTAMAVAVQVEQGKLKWTDTLATLFPELAPSMRPEYRQRTLLDVLAFRAGFMPMLQWAEYEQVPISTLTLPEQRLEFARWLLAQTPVNVPGSTTEYCNPSYVLAGTIIERASGKAFEQTMQDTVLAPLGLRGKYGLPQTVGADQPAAHLQTSPGVFEPVDPDSPVVLVVPTYLNSAGLLCMPVSDYARYAQIHLQALRGKPTLLKADTFKVLHTAPGKIPGSDFGLALGWGVLTQGGKTTYEFTGSIDVMSAYIKIVPGDNRAVIVLNNYDAADKLDTLFTQSSAQLLALKPIR